MSDSERPGEAAPGRAKGQACGANELIARAQELLDMPRPVGGYPLEWYLEAAQVGDLTAIATLALRSG